MNEKRKNAKPKYNSSSERLGKLAIGMRIHLDTRTHMEMLRSIMECLMIT